MKHTFSPAIRLKQLKQVDITAIRRVAISITNAMPEVKTSLSSFLSKLSTEIYKINQKHG